jgi:signal transduction histidine kinase
LLGFGGALALLLWRKLPIAMVAVVAGFLCVYLAIGYPPGPSLLPGPASLVLLGFAVRRGVAWACAAGMAVAVMLGQIIGDGDNDHLAIAAAGWSIAAVLGGQLGAARLERRRLSERQAITDERLRIAQDLHDSVAHAMATINVQAGTAAHLLTRQPDKVDHAQLGSALESIRAASGEVLDELGAILGLLRRDASAERQPQYGIERLEDLVARARADGLDVLLQLQPSSLATSASHAAYRVVQEALSNVRQHAGLSAAVQVVVGERSVSVIDDGGRGARPAKSAGEAAGFGLRGMRERVEASGGTLVAEPSGPGFRVIASWP